MSDLTPSFGFSWRRHIPLRITVIYAVAGSLWILLSDKLLAAIVRNQETFSRLQTYKGWLFVAVTSVLLFFILRLEQRARRQAEGRHHHLFDVSAEALFVLDSQGQILDANQTAVARFGYGTPRSQATSR